MLVAKVNPPAKKILQINPFQQTEVIAEYMIAKCTKLVIGGSQGSLNDEIEFQVKFGNLKYEQNPDGTNKPPILDTVLTTKVIFSQSELSDWGTDDTIVYNKIANKIGFNIESTQVISDMIFTF
jgi:hypothetical protein